MVNFAYQLTSEESEKLKNIYIIFRNELMKCNLIEKFRSKMQEVGQYKKYTDNSLVDSYWNKSLEFIRVELFSIYLNKFDLTPRQRFMHYTYMKCKPLFRIKENQFFLHRYILGNGKGGMTDLNWDAYEYNRNQLNLSKPYDLKVFLYYFKQFYQVSDLVLDNLSIFIELLELNLFKSRIVPEIDIIHHYYLEFNEEWNTPKSQNFMKYKRESINIQEIILKCLRRSENSLRSRLGLKEIGNGYVREQMIYNQLIKFIDTDAIKRWYRPNWLNGLELDFYFKIGKREYAIEHQGEQHVRAINFFGGQDSFLNQIKRDKLKLDICTEENVLLFYCYYDDKIIDFIERAREKILSECTNI